MKCPQCDKELHWLGGGIWLECECCWERDEE